MLAALQMMQHCVANLSPVQFTALMLCGDTERWSSFTAYAVVLALQPSDLQMTASIAA
jgi:hypothetical protein